MKKRDRLRSGFGGLLYFGGYDGGRLLLRGAAGGKGVANWCAFGAVAAGGWFWLLCRYAHRRAEQECQQAEKRCDGVESFLHPVTLDVSTAKSVLLAERYL